MRQDHTGQSIGLRSGVYGIHLDGIPAGDEWAFASVGPDAETWRIAATIAGGAQTPRGEHVDDFTAVACLPDGAWAHHDRQLRTAQFHLPRAVPGQLFAHPLLGGTGVIAAHWRGEMPLHAGAVLIGGRAWGILGERERGKSTTLAGLHAAGAQVFVDDLLVVTDDLMAHAGPRTLDLRRDVAAQFADAVEIQSPGTRERFRLRLPTVPSTAPVAGLLALDWGDELSISRVPVLERLPAIAGALAIRRPAASPRGLMSLAELPFYRVTRPKRMDGLQAASEAIIALAGRSA